jgi:hypothetical protein
MRSGCVQQIRNRTDARRCDFRDDVFDGSQFRVTIQRNEKIGIVPTASSTPKFRTEQTGSSRLSARCVLPWTRINSVRALRLMPER